jgi:hypothetical protein
LFGVILTWRVSSNLTPGIAAFKLVVPDRDYRAFTMGTGGMIEAMDAKSTYTELGRLLRRSI